MQMITFDALSLHFLSMHNSSKDALKLNTPIFAHMIIIGKEIKWKVCIIVCHIEDIEV